MNNNDILKLCKEKEGLKVGYEKYKRKYKSIRNILHRKLYFKIDGLKIQRNHFMFRLKESTDTAERREIQAILRVISNEINDLELIYEMCVEVGK
jgi:hypothetical protein